MEFIFHFKEFINFDHIKTTPNLRPSFSKILIFRYGPA